MTQHEQIIQFITENGSITPMDAWDMGITKLATRVSEMISVGYRFTKTMEHSKNRHGKPVHFMRYRLDV